MVIFNTGIPDDDNKVIEKRLTQLDGEELEPDTMYEFRVQAQNNHSDPDERLSAWATVDGKTLCRFCKSYMSLQ